MSNLNNRHVTTLLSTIDNWPDATVQITSYAFLAFFVYCILK